MRLKTFFAWFFMMFFVEDLVAQTYRGCRSSGIIYTNPPTLLYGWTSGISESCPPRAMPSTLHSNFIRNAPAPNSCPIGLLSLGGSGVLVDYQIVNCPIDNLAYLLILPLAIMGILKLRRSFS